MCKTWSEEERAGEKQREHSGYCSVAPPQRNKSHDPGGAPSEFRSSNDRPDDNRDMHTLAAVILGVLPFSSALICYENDDKVPSAYLEVFVFSIKTRLQLAC